MANAQKKEVKSLKLPEGNFKIHGFYFNRWEVSLPHEMSREDILNYEFWQHVSTQLRPYDQVTVMSEDMSFMATVVVIGVEPRVGAKVKVIDMIDFAGEDISASRSERDDYEVKWRGPAAKWSVVRKSDGVVVSEGMDDKETAGKALGSHLIAVSR